MICYAVLFSWMVDDRGISADLLAKVLGHLLRNYTQVCRNLLVQESMVMAVGEQSVHGLELSSSCTQHY